MPFRLFILLVAISSSCFGQTFKVGFAKQNITPTRPTPMWGYGARHDKLSTGVLDALHAKACVIQAGTKTLAIVGLDLGRSPRDDMMTRIRAAIKAEAGIDFVLMSGSHTHHGPVLELLDEKGKGKDKFDDAIAYTAELEQKLIHTIVAAAGELQDAQIGWAAKQLPMNRNRHSKITPKPVDQELGVIRFDDVNGKPLVIIANFAAHPTMIAAADLRFSADWPGQMASTVEATMNVPCIFMQGASGDMSTRTDEDTRGHIAYGKAVGEHVVELAKKIATTRPDKPSIQAKDQTFEFEARLPLNNPLVRSMFSLAFFPELTNAVVVDEVAQGKIKPHLTTVLINEQLALVGGSGEFFCNHAIRLKERSRADETFFFGYCNGHNMYFPTIEAAAEGGYGADPTVSWVSLGAGEEMMNNALINIYTMLGAYKFKLGGL
ncbi:MAG: neutral/alkaline non-lysosomal ceramidase N-terminal domain-containing protein [Planctomycetales bacterium]|nr:neutral/alkaline non-lysosomal ceramidase N-terminal domain-containing protein [Planctomycetales bacterium]